MTNRRLAIGVCAISILTSLAAIGAAGATERSLAGIRVFSPVSAALKKLGGPTQILTGGQVPEVATTMYGPQIVTLGGGGTAAGRAGYGAPTGQLVGTTANQMNQLSPDSNQSVYVFQPSSTCQVGILASAGGRVIGIMAAGTSGGIRTTRNIGLGSTYAKVVELYGYPESHEINSYGLLVAHYEEHARVRFIFDHQVVVGIYVGVAD